MRFLKMRRRGRHAGIWVHAKCLWLYLQCGTRIPCGYSPPFTEDLERLTDWLEQCGVTTVALESTGVYWIPIFEILEQRGIRPCLVNARHMKNVPGRRTDWHECQGLQFLHSPEAPTAFVVSTAAPIATGRSDPVPGRAFHTAVDQRYSRRTAIAWLRQPCALPYLSASRRR